MSANAYLWFWFTAGWWAIAAVKIYFFSAILATEVQRYIEFLGWAMVGYMVTDIIMGLTINRDR